MRALTFSARVLATLLAAAVLAAGSGCQTKRPKPSADSTRSMMGPGPGDRMAFQGQGDQMVVDPDSTLEARDAGTGLDAFTGPNAVRGAVEAVFFDFDRAEVKPAERPKIDAAAAWLNSNAGSRVLLEGYCDWKGTTEYNLGLGDRRAGSVRTYLESLGITADRIEVLSKGDLEATEGAGEAQMALDRRVEFVFAR